jgi:hypothetical protein
MHSALPESKLAKVKALVWKHRRKIAMGVIVAMPLVSRVVPDFPTGEAVAFLRMFLGA